MKIDLEMDTKLEMETELKVMIKQNMKIQISSMEMIIFILLVTHAT